MAKTCSTFKNRTHLAQWVPLLSTYLWPNCLSSKVSARKPLTRWGFARFLAKRPHNSPKADRFNKVAKPTNFKSILMNFFSFQTDLTSTSTTLPFEISRNTQLVSSNLVITAHSLIYSEVFSDSNRCLLTCHNLSRRTSALHYFMRMIQTALPDWTKEALRYARSLSLVRGGDTSHVYNGLYFLPCL